MWINHHYKNGPFNITTLNSGDGIFLGKSVVLPVPVLSGSQLAEHLTRRVEAPGPPISGERIGGLRFVGAGDD